MASSCACSRKLRAHSLATKKKTRNCYNVARRKRTPPSCIADNVWLRLKLHPRTHNSENMHSREILPSVETFRSKQITKEHFLSTLCTADVERTEETKAAEPPVKKARCSQSNWLVRLSTRLTYANVDRFDIDTSGSERFVRNVVFGCRRGKRAFAR